MYKNIKSLLANGQKKSSEYRWQRIVVLTISRTLIFGYLWLLYDNSGTLLMFFNAHAHQLPTCKLPCWIRKPFRSCDKRINSPCHLYEIYFIITLLSVLKEKYQLNCKQVKKKKVFLLRSHECSFQVKSDLKLSSYRVVYRIVFCASSAW